MTFPVSGRVWVRVVQVTLCAYISSLLCPGQRCLLYFPIFLALPLVQLMPNALELKATGLPSNIVWSTFFLHCSVPFLVMEIDLY